ncbi:MAG TPA: YceI family protein [Acidimicrobiales bacterium]|jgi:polyisoprenoid-binding protein YceI|nr:YceI family protein [Acidimicrobiales bacterium]
MTVPEQSAGTLATLAGSWTLDPDHSSITFTTKAAWLFPVKGTAKAISGGGQVDANGTVSGSLVFDAASIDTKNQKRDTHLRTADFFEVDTYPTFTFTVTGARPLNPGQVELSGTLTIRDQTRPVTLTAAVQSSDTAATLSTEFDIDRSDWGLTWAKMGAGLVNHVVIQAQFTKG